MASKSRPSDIDDDWEEVEKAGSISSLSSSSDEDLILLSRPTSPLGLSQSSQIKHSSRTSRTVEYSDYSEKNIPNPPATISTTPPQARSADDLASENDNCKREHAVNDPTIYHEALLALTEVIEKTLSQAQGLTPPTAIDRKCELLSQQVTELEPILSACSKHWVAHRAGMAAGELPLNPNLLDWMSHLKVQLLGAQAEMTKLLPDRQKCTGASIAPEDKEPGAAPYEALHEYEQSLTEALKVIGDFMPLIRSDYDQFRTRHVAIPTSEPTPERRSRSHRDPPNPALARLRRELYDLKDQMRVISGLLQSLCNGQASHAIPDSPSALGTLAHLDEAITTILTNHVSEWFESDVRTAPKTVISFPEFLQLSPDVIHDVTGALKELHSQLDVGDDPYIKHHYSQKEIINHQIVLLTEGGQLQELLSTLSFLESLLLPGNE